MPSGPHHNFLPSESASFQQSCKGTKILSSHSRMHRLVSFGKCTKKQNKAVPTTCLSGIVTYSQGLCGNYIFVLPKELWVPKLGTTPLSSWGTGWTTGLG